VCCRNGDARTHSFCLQDQSSCPPLNKPQILAYPRDPTVPGTNDITFPGPISWDGVAFNYSIHYVEFSTRMSIGENAADGGYVVHKRDSWKVSSCCCHCYCGYQGVRLCHWHMHANYLWSNAATVVAMAAAAVGHCCCHEQLTSFTLLTLLGREDNISHM
jgi:hypothetical protein